MFGVKKCISGKTHEQTPVFESMVIPEWMAALHIDDARREQTRRALLKRHITKLDNPDGFEKEVLNEN